MADVNPQVLVGPEIVPSVNGTFDTASVLAMLEPHELFAITLKLPVVNSVLFIVANKVVVVELPENPEGSAQVYDVAPGDARAV